MSLFIKNSSLRLPRLVTTSLLSLLFLLFAVQSASADYVKGDNLVLDLPFTNDTGTTVVDDSIYHGNGTNHDSVLYTLPSGAKYRYFDGSTMYVEFPNSVPINFTGDWTIEFWFQTTYTITTTTDRIIAKGTTEPKVIMTNSYLDGSLSCGDTPWMRTTDVGYNDNNWHHLAYTWDNDAGSEAGVTVYVDGVPVSTTMHGTYAPMAGTSSKLYIAADPQSSGKNALVNLTMVREYNKTLSQSEVMQNYEDGQQYFYTNTININATMTAIEGIDFNIPVTLVNASAGGVTVNYTTTLLVKTIGDSIYACHPYHDPDPDYYGEDDDPTAAWEYILGQRLTDSVIDNKGVGGQRTDEGYARLQTDVFADDPDFVFVGFGVNDLSQGSTVEQIEANLTAIYTACYANGTRPIATEMTPWNNANAAQHGYINDINAWINTYCPANGIPVVHWYDVMNDPANPGHMKAGYNADGVHPSKIGYQAMGNNINLSIFGANRAVAYTNYIPANGTLNFPIGSTSANISIDLLDDGEIHNNTTLRVRIRDPVTATIGTNNNMTVTIAEADLLTYTIAASQTTVTESDTTITLTVTKTGTTDFSSTVDIATADGTATQPDDYTAISQTLTFTSAQTSRTVVLSIKGHPIQTDRTFTVALSNPTGNATLGSPNSVLITIQPKSEIMEGGVVIAQYWPILIVILFVGFIIAATVVMLMLLRSGRGNPNMLIMISLVSGVTIVIVAVIAFVGTMLYNGLFGGL